jgi:hypothetical protein
MSFRPNVLTLLTLQYRMRRIKSNYHHLQVLRKANPQLRKAIIKNCTNDLVKAISECVLNVLKDNLQLSACQKKKLQKFKVSLRSLADKHVPLCQDTFDKPARMVLVPLLSAILYISDSFISFARQCYVKCTSFLPII